MRLDWIVGPVAQSGMAAAGLSLLLYLFCTLKIEMRSRERAVAREAATAAERAVAHAMAELEKRLDDAVLATRAGGGSATAATALRPGINLDRRIHVLRRHRRGETADEIARSLGAPAGEVRLLIKVHRILMEQALDGPEGRMGPAERGGAPEGALKTRRDSADISQ